MKTTFFLLLCLLLLTVKCDSAEQEAVRKLCEGASPKSKTDCFGYFNATIQKDYEWYCCYMEYKLKNKPSSGAGYTQEFKGCNKFDKDDYEDINAWKESIKAEVKKDNNNEVETFEVVCDSSSFLKFGLVSLFAALLI